jgi:voltage-gated potassium channel
MISLALAFQGLWRAVAAVWRDPETKALPVVAGLLLLTGTIFYWHTEHWTIVQALYFSVVTLTTVGYGDLHPTSAGTQIFTIVYILTGFGVLVALLTSVAQEYLKAREARAALSGRRLPGAAARPFGARRRARLRGRATRSRVVEREARCRLSADPIRRQAACTAPSFGPPTAARVTPQG